MSKAPRARYRRVRVEVLEQRIALAADLIASVERHPGSYLAALDRFHPSDYLADRILVQFASEDDVAAFECRDASTASELHFSQRYDIEPGLRGVSLPSGMSVADALALFEADPRVVYAQPSFRVQIEQTPNDPSYNSGALWALNNTGQNSGTNDADIDAPEAWDITFGSRDVVVAVLDTGIDYTHPDLAANIWNNPNEIAGNGIDDDGNGYIDDVRGWDFVNDDADPADDGSHGTHVAGTIAAVANNGIGVVGVAPNVRLMPLKIMDASGFGSDEDAIAALNYAVNNGAKISNNSWGDPVFSSALQTAIQNTRAAGHIFVAAAGNNSTNIDNSPFAPASLDSDNIISVAASTRNDTLSGYSNYGAMNVDLAAPGDEILSTIPGGGYGLKSGTSMAAPHVAGVAALMESIRPDMTYTQIIQAMLNSVDVLPAFSGKTVSGGRLNAARALSSIVPSVQLTTVADGLAEPIDVTSAGDNSGRLFVIERAGNIRIIDHGALLPTPLVTVPGVITGGERGLLGLAFHPDFANSAAWGWRRFYVYYSATTSTPGFDSRSVVAEFRVSDTNPNTIEAGSQRILLTFDQPQSNHNGGDLAFGPDDHLLYISSGDGGNANDTGPNHTPNLGNAQDKSNLLGKILRIDVAGTNGPGGQYGIPASNPFVGQAGVREEIYAYGLRNPFRMSFDDGPNGAASPDRLFVGDVGQNAFEEVDIVTAGGNYGWRIREGAHPNPGDPGTTPPGVPLIDPIAEYPNPTTGIAVIGGQLYRGSAIPALKGKYIFGDLLNGKLFGLTQTSPTTWQFLTPNVVTGNPIGANLNGFGTDDAGEIYAVAGSKVLRFDAFAPNPDLQIVDNGNFGFSTTGGWRFLTGEGYDNDINHNLSFNSGAVATWNFSNLNPGMFRVSATWSPYVNRATNSPFTVFADGSPTTVLINQEQAPNDFADAGANWEDLGTFAASGNSLMVRLADNANEYVIADAVRIQRVGNIVVAPEIDVLDGTTPIALNGTVDFGTATVGSPVTKTFTVRNSGNSALTLGGTISLPPGFSLAQGFGSSSLSPGQTTTFAVRLDASSVQSPQGLLSFATNDSDENPFQFTIKGNVIAPSLRQIIDNGDSGYSSTGSWNTLTTEGYLGDVQHNNSFNSGAVATWSFSNVAAGVYRVSATWSNYVNRATNAPYTILDGAASLATVPINQELAPNDLSDAGAVWEDLGNFTINSGNLIVRLSDSANEYVIADAIRIEKVGNVTLAPEIDVLDGPNAIALNGLVDFGTTTTGTPMSKTFTVRNSGNDNLTLGSAIMVPSGFTLTQGFGILTLAPGQSTSFVVRLDAPAAQTSQGVVSFSNNDGDENPFQFTIKGSVVAPGTKTIIDNGDAGYSSNGSWKTLTTEGFQGDIQHNNSFNSGSTATWSFANVAPGIYRVSATWTAFVNRATNAPYTVFDGSTSLGTTSINQELAPNDFADAGVNWEDLGTFTINGNTLVVRLSDAANEYVIADAIRIEKVGEVIPAPEIVVLDGTTSIPLHGTVDFGVTSVGAPVTKTFTVRNSGNDTLTLTNPISLPSGFSLAQGFGATTIPAGGSTTFAVRLDAGAVQSSQGLLSFGNDDGDENPFQFTIKGSVVSNTFKQIIDNGDAGYATTGQWKTLTTEGFQSDVQHNLTFNSGATATWTFANLSPGSYRVSATWSAYVNRATDAPYTIIDGSSPLGTVRKNQELAPDDLNDAGAGWEDLGVFPINGTTLIVRLGDNANEYVIADAVRIERVG